MTVRTPASALPSARLLRLPGRRSLAVLGAIAGVVAAVLVGFLTTPEPPAASAPVAQQRTPGRLAPPPKSDPALTTEANVDAVFAPAPGDAPLAARRPRAVRQHASAGRIDPAPPSALAASGIPSTALAAYQRAAAREHARDPQCHLRWPLLGGIGRVESNHGRFAGAVLHTDGVSTPRIIGIPLNGHGTALIRDTDGGRIDGDRVFDHAVGPMQFIPSTWATWGVDANGDGVRDPFNLFDAAAAAAGYLCAAGRDLGTAAGQVRAILSYNHSAAYVREVMGVERIYAGQTGITVPVLPTLPDSGAPTSRPTLAPVDPAPPGGAGSSPAPAPRPAPSESPTPRPTPSCPSPSPSPSSSGSPAGSPSTSPSTAPGCGPSAHASASAHASSSVAPSSVAPSSVAPSSVAPSSG